MTEIKSCPFCGGDGSLSMNQKDKIVFCSCWDCGARGFSVNFDDLPTQEDVEEAIAAWNERKKINERTRTEA